MNRQQPLYLKIRGFTSLETLSVLIAFIMMMILCTGIVQRYREHTQAILVACQLQKVHDAAYNYLKDHLSEFKLEGHYLSLKMFPNLNLKNLIKEGYLPLTFPQNNGYNQHYIIRVGVPKEKEEAWFLCTTTKGGKPIPSHLWRIMGPLLSAGGYRPDNKAIVLDKFQRKRENVHLVAIVDPGHLMCAKHLDNFVHYSSNLFIYRKNPPTNPQFIQTDLKLGEHSIHFEMTPNQAKIDHQGLRIERNINKKTQLAKLGSKARKHPEKLQMLTLQEESEDYQNRLTLSPEMLCISRRKAFRCHYDLTNKRAYLLIDPPNSTLRWGDHWTQLPCHNGIFSSEKEMQQAANRICRYDNLNSPIPSLGRLFLMESNCHLKIFICSKSKSDNENSLAYELYDAPPSAKQKILRSEDNPSNQVIKGYVLRDTIQKNPSKKLILFLKEKISIIYLLSSLDKKFFEHLNSKSTALRDDQKRYSDFYKKNFVTEIQTDAVNELSNILESYYEKQSFLTLSYREMAKKYIEYKKNSAFYNAESVNDSHIVTLATILRNLDNVLDPAKDFSIQEFFLKHTTNNYFNVLKDCSRFSTAWLPTLYVFSHCVNLENPCNDHPFFKALYEEAN